MAKGSNTTRSSGASAKAATANISKGSNVTVDNGYPQSTLDEAQRELATLNAKYGFNPQVHFINAKIVSEVDKKALGIHTEDNTLNIGTEAMNVHNMGRVIDHEYGHLFDVRAMPPLKQMKSLLKLNKEGSPIYKRYQQLKEEFKEMKSSPLFPKWEKLDKIYNDAYKDAKKYGGASEYKYKNIKEYAAEVFSGAQLRGVSKLGERE